MTPRYPCLVCESVSLPVSARTFSFICVILARTAGLAKDVVKGSPPRRRKARDESTMSTVDDVDVDVVVADSVVAALFVPMLG